MEPNEWKDEYAIGIEIIDEQHKKWLSLFRQLQISFKANKHMEVLGNILDELLEYTQYHFDTEESLLERHNYPNKEEHIHLHEGFKSKLIKLSTDYKNKKATLTYELISVLSNWLIDHILWEDKQYVSFVKK